LKLNSGKVCGKVSKNQNYFLVKIFIWKQKQLTRCRVLGMINISAISDFDGSGRAKIWYKL